MASSTWPGAAVGTQHTSAVANQSGRDSTVACANTTSSSIPRGTRDW